MNKILLAFALIAVISAVRADSSEEASNENKLDYLKKVVKKQRGSVDKKIDELDEQCPGITNKLKSAIPATLECADAVDDSLTMCQAIQASALNCTTPLVKAFSDCLSEDAKKVPELMTKMLISVTQYICHLNGESIFELMNPCLLEELSEEHECEKSFLTFVDKIDDKIPTPSQVCTALTDLRSCSQKKNYLASCKNQKTKDAANGFADAMLAPCSHFNKV